MKPIVASLAASLLLAAPAASLEPANPKASAKARAVLGYLEGLEKRPDKRVVSGQFNDYGSVVSLKLLDEAKAADGHCPALFGGDYAEFRTGGLLAKKVNEVAIDFWRRGGLVTISAHLYNPVKGKGGLRDTDVDLEKLLEPGTDVNRRWLEELDVLAAGLEDLREAGVVVLWRPFHEMNGGWFWWGGKDPAAFIRLWKHMFDRFTREKGLDNLLWVYSPNHGSRTAAYYAGDAYVDVVGLDAYTDFIDEEHIRGYDEVAALKKPFGFTEFGPHGSSDPPGDYDYRRFIEGVSKNFPRTVFFLSWSDKWSIARNRFGKELLEHPWIVNLEDLPPGLAGREAGDPKRP